jgi:ribonucleoside-diphosphate reductase beta chain
LHLAFTQNILKYLKNEDSEGFTKIVEECKDIVSKMFKDAAEEEMDWARYLFKDGSMLGLNDEILIQYMKHLCNKRSKAVGVGNIFEETPNPILWIKNWTESKHVQVAPQETQIETYKVGSFKQDTSDTDFSDFNF